MDSSSQSCEDRHSAVRQMIRNMQMYCLNVMRNRTVDQQLSDFSGIMNSSLELKIMYKKTELEVRYSIGLAISASVVGVNESVRTHKNTFVGCFTVYIFQSFVFPDLCIPVQTRFVVPTKNILRVYQ
jgi:hypothetical protein